MDFEKLKAARLAGMLMGDLPIDQRPLADLDAEERQALWDSIMGGRRIVARKMEPEDIAGK